MDHQFLNVDCHPSALQRPALHPSYPGPPGGAYSLDVRQPSDGNPPVDRFDPYRLPASSDSSGHASLTSSQFSAFDSFYKAYQSAYGQNSALAGVMFGHPSYRFDGPLLPHDQQLMLPTGFLQYPPLFPNSSLYASLPGSSANPRYQADYFGQNLSGLSSFSNSSKFNSGPDLGSAQSWLGLERSMTSNLLNAFVAPSISSESSKDDRHGNDHLAKKVGEGDHYEPRVAFSNHLAHQPSTSSQLKFNRQAEETSNNSLRHHLLSSTSSLLLNDMHRDTSQRRGNGEVVYPPRRQDYSYANEKPDFATLNSGKDSFQKRGVPVSPQSLSKSTSFPIMTTFPEVVSTGDGPPSIAPNFARHNSDYLFNHYASKMYPPNSFSSELLSLQSKSLGSTIYQHRNASSQQRSDDKSRQEGTAKAAKAEDGSNSKNCTSFLAGPKQVPLNNPPSDKTFEQKFHRPFELVPWKSTPTDENRHTAAGNAPTPLHKVRRSSAKSTATDEKVERVGSFQKNAHHQGGRGSNHLQHFFKPGPVVPTSCTDRNDSTAESFVATSSSNFIRTKPSQENKVARAGDETPLNLACGDGKTSDPKRSRSPPVRLSASKIDREEAWRRTLKNGNDSKELDSRTSDLKCEELYDDYDYECERKIARLTTIISSTPSTLIGSSNNSQEKIDFLSSLGLSTVEKCKELEFEKRRRRKRQLRERSVSPTLLKDEESVAGGGSGCCTSDCPHKNGLDKEAMLAMLGLHQVGVCDGKDKCYEDGGMCPVTSYGDTSAPYSHPFSYPPSTSFYSFPTQYPSLSTSVYSFYPPGYLTNQPSSAPNSSSSSSTASSLNSPYCRFYDNPHITSSKTTLSYPYQSSLANCFDGQQVYYQQGKDERTIHPKVDLSSSNLLDGSNYEGYDDVGTRNLLDSSEVASTSAKMGRCTSSTPAGDRRNADESSPTENGLPRGNDPRPVLFHWPGVESVVEAYHRYIEERATEKQLLLEHSTKLDKLNSQVLNTYEQLKNKISDLRKVREGLEEERRSTQSQLEVLKNFIVQLK